MMSVRSALLGGAGMEDVCPEVSTKYPETWGPFAWETFHIMAHHFPTQPSIQEQQACENFVSGIPTMLPCNMCGQHFRQFVQKYTADNGSMCVNQEQLSDFFCKAHNNVNQGTDKPLQSCCPTKLTRRYGSMPLCIPNSIN